MKRAWNILPILGIFLLLGLSFVSAGIFSDVLNKFTGSATQNKICTDSDGGINYNIKGYAAWMVRSGTQIWIDYCENFSVLNESYCDVDTPKTTLYNCQIENKICLSGVCVADNKTSVFCQAGCLMNEKCYPVGYKKLGKYCLGNNSFVNQIEDNQPCSNNFECKSSVCKNNRCMSSYNLFRDFFLGR